MKVDSTNYDENNEGQGVQPQVGMYHALILQAAEKNIKDRMTLVVKFHIVEGTVPGQSGAEYTEFFSMTEKAKIRIVRLAVECGIMKTGEVKEINPAEFMYKQLIINLKADTYKGQAGVKLDFLGMWRMTHEKVSSVPRDKDIATAVVEDVKRMEAERAGLTPAPIVVESPVAETTTDADSTYADL